MVFFLIYTQYDNITSTKGVITKRTTRNLKRIKWSFMKYEYNYLIHAMDLSRKLQMFSRFLLHYKHPCLRLDLWYQTVRFKHNSMCQTQWAPTDSKAPEPRSRLKARFVTIRVQHLHPTFPQHPRSRKGFSGRLGSRPEAKNRKFVDNHQMYNISSWCNNTFVFKSLY